MSETVDDIGSLEGKAVELIERFETIAEQHGPQAVELGLDAVRVIGAQSLIGGVLGLIGVTVAFFLGKKLYKIIVNWKPEEHDNKSVDRDFWPYGPMGMACILGGISMFFALIDLLNVWLWVALFYPELWLVGKLFR